IEGLVSVVARNVGEDILGQLDHSRGCARRRNRNRLLKTEDFDFLFLTVFEQGEVSALQIRDGFVMRGGHNVNYHQPCSGFEYCGRLLIYGLLRTALLGRAGLRNTTVCGQRSEDEQNKSGYFSHSCHDVSSWFGDSSRFDKLLKLILMKPHGGHGLLGKQPIS